MATNLTQARNVFWVNMDLKHYQHCVVNLSLDRLDTFVNNQLIGAFFFLQTQETNALISAVLEVQPRVEEAVKQAMRFVYEVAESILSKLHAVLLVSRRQTKLC